MKVLFDHNVPAKLVRYLPGYEIAIAEDLGWARLSNGDLLAQAEASGFEVMLTGDKKLSYQQNLKGRKVGLVVLGGTTWSILRHHTEAVIAALDRARPGSFEQLPTLPPAPRKSRRRRA